MKDLVIGTILGIVLILAIGIAAGVLPRKDAYFDQAVSEAKKQLKIELSEQENKALIDAAKALQTSADKLTQVSDQPEKSDSHMYEDKLVEIQDQINELKSEVDKKSKAIEALNVCNNECLTADAKKKCDCTSCPKKTTAAVVKKTKTKVVKKEEKKPVICESRPEYQQCLNDKQNRWDELCKSKTRSAGKITSKMYEKTRTSASEKVETHAALITIDTDKPHAMCLTPRDFYKTSCKNLICN